MEDILIGSTDRTILVFIPDPASTTGAGKTGLAAAAVTVTYTRVETDNDVVHSDVTSSVNDLSALTDAHNDWGWKEVNSSLSKGLYRLDIADAVFASGAWYAVVQVTITSGTAAATPKAFRLVARNDLDGVRLGLTALPNAAADGAGGLPISDAGGLDLDAKIGALTYGTANRVNVQVYGMEAGTVTAAAIATGAIDADAIADNAIDAGAIASDAITATKIATGAITSAKFAAGAIDATAIATGAIDADALATDAVSEIQSGLSTLTAANVQTECEEALQAYHLDHLIASADPGGVVANSSFLAKLTSKSVTPAFSDYDNTTDSLQAVRDRGDAAWATATGFSTHSATDVWAAGTRTLTSAANITSTGGTTVPQTGDAYSRLGAPAGASLAADVVAIKSETASIVADTNELQTDWANGGRLDLIVDAILDDTGTSGVVVASGSKTGYSLAAAGLDQVTIETGLSARQALSVIAAASAGVVSGAATSTVTIAACGVPATNRVTATCDADGNRSSVTLNLPS